MTPRGFKDHAANFVEPEDIAKDHGTRSEVMKDHYPTIKSLLLEDGVDVSERPISQFCELCLKILSYINDETKILSSCKRKRSKPETSKTEIQHHENDSDLKRSAANGCGLCVQFVQGLQEAIHQLYEPETPPGTVSCRWSKEIASWQLRLLPTAEQKFTSNVTISHALAPGNLRTSPSTL
jgi:hypothetical protein